MAQLALNGFDINEFLRNDWQQRPRVIRNALPAELFSLEPSELAGLACEAEVESRLITGNPERGFVVTHGPVPEQTFRDLPDNDWTVLVQAVDHWVPDVAALLDYFRFIPNWRIDDVMVSFAANGGSAGPHYDHYDVFLIQGKGSRRWQVGEHINSEPALIQHPDLLLLSDFTPVQEWKLHTGDILYLPPCFPHWGISTSSDCMTYSVGFRAPSQAELLSDMSDQAILELSEFQRFSDRGVAPAGNPGEITADTIARVQQLVLEPLSDRSRLARWFGQFMTEQKYGAETLPRDEAIDGDHFDQLLAQNKTILRDPASRFAYFDNGNRWLLFVNGQEFTLPDQHQPLLEMLCSQTTFTTDAISAWVTDPECSTVLLALYQLGSLYFEDELHDS